MRVFGLLLLFLPGCPGPNNTTEGSNTQSTSSSTDPSSTGTAGTTSTVNTTSETDPTNSSSGSTTSFSTCGDGVIDRGEACDDGNTVNGDGCNQDCQPSGVELWSYTKDGGKSDVAEAVGHSDSSILVAGYTFVEGEGFNGWIARLDFAGNLEWEKSVDAGNSDTDYFHGIAVAADGTFVAAGATGKPDKNIWVRSFSSAGELQWSDDEDSGFGRDYVRNVAVSTGGQFAVAALRTLEGGNAELWTRLYDANGTIIATGNYPIGTNSNWSVGPGIAFDEPNDRIITSFATFVEGSISETLIATTYSGGPPSWVYTANTSDTIFNGLKVIEEGFITASWDLTEGFVVSHRDSTGAPLWRSSECTGSTGRTIAIDPNDGNIVAIGQGQGGKDSNIRLCKFDPSGKLLWGKDIDGGLGNDRGWSVDILDSGMIIAAGDQMGDGNRTDAWVAAYSP